MTSPTPEKPMIVWRNHTAGAIGGTFKSNFSFAQTLSPIAFEALMCSRLRSRRAFPLWSSKTPESICNITIAILVVAPMH